MFFRYIFLFFVFLSYFSSPLPLFSAEQEEAPLFSLQDRYLQAKFFYNQLESDTNAGSQRNAWLKASQNFRKVYLANPKSELAPPSLFMLGKIYFRMFEKFHHKIDLEESIGYYRDCATLFPHHRLADDALFFLGNIYNETTKDYQTAADYYNLILSKYPAGDMNAQAASQLKLLSSTFSIPLPDTMAGDPQYKKLANVLPVKYWSSDDYSRVIIKTSGPVTYSAQLLEPEEDKPRRLYIDFLSSYTEPRYRTPVPISDGLLKQIRTGQFSQDTVRVVLDIESIANYKIFSLPDPFRVVVDIRGEKKAPPPQTPEENKPTDAITRPPINGSQIIVLQDFKKKPIKDGDTVVDETLAIAETPELTLAQQLGLGVRKIVIDPGHGGKDPGAMANDLKEKDIVLRLAKKIERTLSSTLGYQVILTRRDDTFIALEERTAIANGNNADLFISLHVNAHPVSSVHGLETYYLNLSTNREAMRVAAFENATSMRQMSDLQGILADIMKNSKIKESSRLAQNVHNSLVSGLQENGLTMKDLGVKQAPFYVLIGAEMPAILIEVAFISNQKESQKLQEDKFLEAFTSFVSRGVENYIHSNTARLIY